MTTTYEAVTVSGDFITIDLLVWRLFKRRSDRVVDRILAANPDLANEGPFLPIGATVLIPIETPSPGENRVEAIRLWT